VSSDFIHDPHSSIVDAKAGIQLNDTFVKVRAAAPRPPSGARARPRARGRLAACSQQPCNGAAFAAARVASQLSTRRLSQALIRPST
jgi:hypothetical protein